MDQTNPETFFITDHYVPYRRFASGTATANHLELRDRSLGRSGTACWRPVRRSLQGKSEVRFDSRRAYGRRESAKTLSEVAGVRGLFGIDFILNSDIPWLVEVNPRYTASMEVIEFGNGVPMLALHRHAFEPTAPFLTPKPRLDGYIGKAIYFAPQFLEFPQDGPWAENYDESPLGDLPEIADIPCPGQRINA